MFQTILFKMHTKLDQTVQYTLPGRTENENGLHLNPLIGKNITLEFTGRKFCIETGKELKQTYGQGYSFESYVTLPECDECIVRPELCHFHKGTCRDSEWGLAHCFKPHMIYLSNTGAVKIGITRKTQIPTRWIDQGATSAVLLCEVDDRLTSGQIEVEIAKVMGDKTNWRKMLSGDIPAIDLALEKKNVLAKFGDLLQKKGAKIIDDGPVNIAYPVLEYPAKVSAINLDDTKLVEGVLQGIKGQYLIFGHGVLNIRKFQGYEVKLGF